LTKNVTNIAASIRQRLANRARERKEDFGLLLTKYALERLLFRIGQSEYRQIFVLKGALLFELWTEEAHRPTRDADFLSNGDSDPSRFESIFKEICALPVDEDGLQFDPPVFRPSLFRSLHGESWYHGTARWPARVGGGLTFGKVCHLFSGFNSAIWVPWYINFQTDALFETSKTYATLRVPPFSTRHATVFLSLFQ
jgi:Nucleotidyl transferase AbiEii toxin, Type IV TA system